MRARVGYAGGTQKDPTYVDLGNHTETIQIDYDPAVISYDKLLDVFWEAHNPTVRSWSRQYLSLIFTHNAEQTRLAEASKAALAARLGRPVQTVIRPYERFYLAEFYHQKYSLQHREDLMRALFAIYPSERELIDATIAARLNGYLAGYGQPEALAQELAQLGLSLEAQQTILESVGAGAACPVP